MILRVARQFLLAWACLLASVPALADKPAAASGATAAPTTNESHLVYRADYVLNEDGTSSETDYNDIQVHTKAGVDAYSQIRLEYSEKRERLDVLEAYTVSADGVRRDVPKDKIYSQESYSNASGPMYADYKIKVIVFPDLAPGARLVYSFRKQTLSPQFAGYFSLWESFTPLRRYADAAVSLRAPSRVTMRVFARDVQGGKPVVDGNTTTWKWTYRREIPLKAQSMAAEPWEYGPTVMASTYASYSQLGLAFDKKAKEAARVTPEIQAQADAITRGIAGRREQAKALYEWVSRNIRYVAIYLGNGGYEPNDAGSILANRYGDCKDHVVLLEALLAAKGIPSSPVLIGASGGPLWPEVAAVERFNHAISYIPEFDLYLDSTSPYARFGQLPVGDLEMPVVHARDGRLARTPASDERINGGKTLATFDFAADGSIRGVVAPSLKSGGEIAFRQALAQLNGQTKPMTEQALLTQAGFNGRGQLDVTGEATDLTRPTGYRFLFEASDYVDFSVAGGMALPRAPGGGGMRDRPQNYVNPANEVPFRCGGSSDEEETYVLKFPAGVKIDAIPRDQAFKNQGGEYTATWTRDGQTVTAVHRLRLWPVNGREALCKPEDYVKYRDIAQAVRRGFRAQVIYGDLQLPY